VSRSALVALAGLLLGLGGSGWTWYRTPADPWAILEFFAPFFSAGALVGLGLSLWLELRIGHAAARADLAQLRSQAGQLEKEAALREEQALRREDDARRQEARADRREREADHREQKATRREEAAKAREDRAEAKVRQEIQRRRNAQGAAARLRRSRKERPTT